MVLLGPSNSHAAAGEETDVELSVSTAGCSAAAVFRSAALEDCRVGVPFLDALAPPPTHHHHHGSSSTGSGGGGLVPGTVLELYGPSGSGKTEVALNAVAGWVLAKEVGGVGGVAVILDLDFRVSVRRLRRLLLARVKGKMEVVEAALRRVVLARCVDDLEAFSVLETLKYQLDKGSSAGTPTLLVLDSLVGLSSHPPTHLFTHLFTHPPIHPPPGFLPLRAQSGRGLPSVPILLCSSTHRPTHQRVPSSTNARPPRTAVNPNPASM